MSLNLEIKKVDLAPIKNNSDARICTCWGDNKVKYEVTLHKSEVDLVLFLKTINKKLSIKQIEKLVKHINDYGEQKFSEGYNEAEYDAAMHEAGADY